MIFLLRITSNQTIWANKTLCNVDWTFAWIEFNFQTIFVEYEQALIWAWLGFHWIFHFRLKSNAFKWTFNIVWMGQLEWSTDVCLTRTISVINEANDSLWQHSTRKRSIEMRLSSFLNWNSTAFETKYWPFELRLISSWIMLTTAVQTDCFWHTLRIGEKWFEKEISALIISKMVSPISRGGGQRLWKNVLTRWSS